ncbi:MAG: ROK family transcriptional regulator [Anaerolineae bacterium]|nr:ROK family transcriptional regulator [Anaerolineae bacterium]
MRTKRKATRTETKIHNKRLILKTIYDQRRISRADVARVTDLTPPTVSSIVAELLDDGLVEEVGQGPSKVGKPATLLSVADDSRHLIGVDLAESEFRGCVVNLRGQVRHRFSLPMNDRDGEAALALVYELIDELVACSDCTLLGIGIGTPGLMDARRGMVRRAVNLNWEDLPLRDLLEERYHLPVYIANDCQVAALGEYVFGNSGVGSNLIVVKVGRGVGAGIVLNGQLHYGDGSGAGEIGHVVVMEGGVHCRCGRFGCLETVASSSAIIGHARAIAQNNPNSSLHQYISSAADIDTNIVLQALEAGEEELHQVIQVVGRHLGMAVANLVGVLNIHQIMIAGSVTCFGQPLLSSIRQEMQQRALSALTAETQVDFSNLGLDIVNLGAASLVLSHELGLV